MAATLSIVAIWAVPGKAVRGAWTVFSVLDMHLLAKSPDAAWTRRKPAATATEFSSLQFGDTHQPPATRFSDQDGAFRPDAQAAG